MPSDIHEISTGLPPSIHEMSTGLPSSIHEISTGFPPNRTNSEMPAPFLPSIQDDSIQDEMPADFIPSTQDEVSPNGTYNETPMWFHVYTFGDQSPPLFDDTQN